MSRQEYTFEGLGDIGIVKDTDAESLPINAWSDGKNARFREGTVQKFTGHEEMFGATTASSGPIFAMSVNKGSNQFWFYADENRLLGTDGSVHENLSSGTYAATLDVNWNGAQLSGGVIVLNNGYDAPQQWTGTGLTDDFTDLANWPAGMIARVVRAHKQYLIAMDIDDGSGRDGTLLRWSHPAAVGVPPASWDYTDSTKTAGRTTIGGDGGFIVDALKLRNDTIIYKEGRCVRMSWIGGRPVFDFKDLFGEVGLLSRRCAKEFFGRHFVVSNSDVVLHDGQTVESILNRRWQSYLFNAIDATNYARTFVAVNYRKNEIWVCYPETGNSLPNMAMVWNWKDQSIGVRELPPGCAHIEWGVITSGVDLSFNAMNGSYADQTAAFDDQTYAGVNQGMLMCSYTNNRFYRADQANTFDGANVDFYVHREYLPLGVVTNGKMTYSPSNIKTVYEIWPIFKAETGTVIIISIGTRYNAKSAVSWQDENFTVGTDEYAKYKKSGRIIDIKFASTDGSAVELISYKIVYNLSKGSR